MSRAGLPPIRIISAGAGSGKTYRLTQEIVRALDPQGDDAARPEGIVATTFTRKAAAELAERVRQELFAVGRAEQAERIAGGLFGTVNSVCGKLLERFAFEAGISPELRVIEDEEQRALLAEALSDVLDSETIDELERLDRAFGYGGRNPQGDARNWERHVGDIIAAARSNAIGPDALRACAERSLASLLRLFPDPDSAGEEALDRRLKESIASCLAAIEVGSDTTKKTASYAEESRGVLAQLANGDAPSWSRWAKLAKAEQGAKSRDAAAPVAEAAARHPFHPRLRSDLRQYVTGVFEFAARGLETYQGWKRERGLIDFVDQEALVLDLLRLDDVRQTLSGELDVVFVDEFQDTSPIQLAVFLELARLSRRSVWVGDPKQSIYAFRGADPTLMVAVVESIEGSDGADILSKSRRSRPALVEWTSELFAEAFADRWPRDRVALIPDRTEKPGLAAPLEAWVLDATNNDKEAEALASGVAALLGRLGEDPVTVVDRATDEVRPIRPADVAVLCRVNDACARVAAALERIGVRAAIARTGLLGTPEAILTTAALRLLLDARDSLAVAEIVALTAADPEPEVWLADRLAHLGAERRSDEWATDHPIVAAVAGLREELQWLSPRECVERVIQIADLPRWILGWGRGDVRLANLDALRSAATEYEDRCLSSGSAATLAGMLGWLGERAKRGEDAQSEESGEDAVRVLTWHGSKGLEWPVVVVSDLDHRPKERLWGLTVASDAEAIDPADPLRGRWLRFWPWPYGQQKKDIPLADAIADAPEALAARRAARDEHLRLLYVALTRARDHLVLPGRLAKGRLEISGLDDVFGPAGSERFQMPVEPGAVSVPVDGSSVTIDVRTRSFGPSPAMTSDAAEERWFSPAPAERPPKRPAARVAASTLGGDVGIEARVVETIEIGRRLTLTGDPEERLLGNALHGFLAADDADGSIEDGARKDLALGLLRRHGIPGTVAVEELLERSRRLREVLGKRYSVTGWYREWPLRLRLESGTNASGFADLVLDTPGGWVVIDHKSFKGGREQCAAKAIEYAAQLEAYAGALQTATGRDVVERWIQFVVGGTLVRLE